MAITLDDIKRMPPKRKALIVFIIYLAYRWGIFFHNHATINTAKRDSRGKVIRY